ncbi:MAG: hypothetical protein KY450_14000 [Actinobacteria bacterium]|nr:hypothetical protein [Actinomycetota bacterium]
MHVEVDPSVLSTTAGHLRRPVAVAEDFTGQHGALAALVDDAGSAVLIDAARRFLDRWGRGMGLVVDDAQALAERLEAAAGAYLDTEATMAEALG